MKAEALSSVEIREDGLGRLRRSRLRDKAAEARLIGRSRTGDRMSFDDLIACYRGELQRFLASRMDPKDVDDLLQDILLAAWTALRTYDGRAPFRTWLYAIAMNKLRDHFRQRSRMVREVDFLQIDLSVGAAEGAYSAAEWSESLKELLAELPPSQYEVVMLYYHEEFTLAEIATILQRNRNTVKYQFFQAHSRLAAAMRKSPAWRSLGMGRHGGRR